MRRLLIVKSLFTLLILFGISFLCQGQDTMFLYNKDGIYEGRSRSSYTSEPYWGVIRITIKEKKIRKVSFIIRDSTLHETFNEKYEKHFAGNPLYIQQCKNDWQGVQSYTKRLAETGDIDKVDAMSGATWSYNIFKASFVEALNKSK